MRTLPGVAAVLLALASPAGARTIHVPADQPTIAAGIAAAVRGDVVEIACGTYYEHGFAMKSGITVRSATGDPSCVTIDGQGLGRGFLVDHCDATTTFEGITFKSFTAHFDNERGGAIWIISSSPTVRACYFRNCAGSIGAGITVQNDQAAPYIADCRFFDNAGFGVCSLTWTDFNVYRCVFSTSGNGLGLYGGTTHVGRSSFLNGAGVFRNAVTVHVVLDRCLIYGGSFDADSTRCCVTSNPLLCTPGGPDYYVHSNSPCLVRSGSCTGIIGAFGAGCGPAAPIAVTVTSNPPGQPVTVDGVAVTTPAILSWYAMSEHRVSIDSTFSQTGMTRWRFVSWSDGGGRTHDILFTGTPTSLSAEVRRQYKIRTAIITDSGGGAGGQVLPPNAWADEGVPFQLTAVVNAGAAFSDWIGQGAGSYTGPSNPAVLTLYNSVTELAHIVGLGYEFSISASDTDPSVHESVPTGGIRPLYLWLTCARGGLSAFEAHVTGTLPLLGFNPADGVLNAGSGDHLLLAVGNCPSGGAIAKLLGTLNVWDQGGTLCLGPLASDPFGAVDCRALPSFAPDPGVTGFASAGTPCRTGTHGCNGGGDLGIALPTSATTLGEGSSLALASGRPNPFGDECRLSFVMPRAGQARLEIFDVAGRRVATLLDRTLEEGRHEVTWQRVDRDGRRVTGGIYFARLESSGEVRTTKLVVLAERP